MRSHVPHQHVSLNLRAPFGGNRSGHRKFLYVGVVAAALFGTAGPANSAPVAIAASSTTVFDTTGLEFGGSSKDFTALAVRQGETTTVELAIQGPFSPPTNSPVSAPFSLPNGQYGAGQRGTTYMTSDDDTVWSIGDGIVSFVGVVAGVTWVSVTHDAEPIHTVSSYGSLKSVSVSTGDRVMRGQSLGTCFANLHVGVRIDGMYVDPESLWSKRATHAVLDSRYLRVTSPPNRNG